MTHFDAHDFQSPSRSGGENDNSTCVDLACGGGVVELRDSKIAFGAPGDHRLRFTYTEFHTFQAGLRAGHTDGLPLMITRQETAGQFEFRRTGTDARTLTFDQAEVDAFYHDVHTGHYDTRLLAAR